MRTFSFELQLDNLSIGTSRRIHPEILVGFVEPRRVVYELSLCLASNQFLRMISRTTRQYQQLLSAPLTKNRNFHHFVLAEVLSSNEDSFDGC